jgi:hypothetical protein
MIPIPENIYDILISCTYAAENNDNSLSQRGAMEAEEAREWLQEHYEDITEA